MLLRPMSLDDVEPVLALQREASLVALEHIFPPADYPYPLEAMREQWVSELTDPAIAQYVVEEGGLRGFVVLRADELLHLGMALATWGSGLAERAHEEALDLLRGEGHERAWLKVLTDNHRARRFYARLGWRLVGDAGVAPFPPYPGLLHYEITL